MQTLDEKLILDPCCGSRMFWFNKQHPNVLYLDIRDETAIVKDSSKRKGTREVKVKPDAVCDFTALPFANETFWHVAFDPPHMDSLGANSWMAKKYGRLSFGWQNELRKGFKECWRVLKRGGTLVFKWNEHDIKLSEVLPLFDQQPLYGHTTGRQSKTIWLVFVKLTD